VLQKREGETSGIICPGGNVLHPEFRTGYRQHAVITDISIIIIIIIIIINNAADDVPYVS